MRTASPIGLLLGNPVDAKLLRHFLSSMGHGVMVLSEAGEGLRDIDDSGLIIADEANAERHAEGLLQMKREAAPFLLPILVVAGAKSDAASWIKRGFDDVLRMPLVKAELMVRLETFLRLRAASIRAHRESEERFQMTFDEAPSGIAHTGLDGRVLMVNRRLCEMLGYSEAELLRMRSADITFAEDIDATQKLRRRAIAGKSGTPSVEKRYVRKDGTVFWGELLIAAVRDDQGEPSRFISIISDISERKALESQLARVARARRFMAECNRILVHATEETALLSQMCEEAVRSGGYRMAWAGMAQHDAAKTVLPVASAGRGADLVNGLVVSWSADDPSGRGPTGQAIRSGELVVIGDIAADPDIAPWHGSAAERGLRSVVVLPLKVAGHPVGGLAIYSNEVQVVSEDERALLKELAADISYGIETLRTRQAHASAEAALREADRFARATIDALPMHICVLDENGTIITANRAWREFAAANGDVGRDCVTEGCNYLEVCDRAALAGATESARVAAAIRAAIAGNDEDFSLEYPCHSPTEQRWFLLRINRFTGAGATRVVVSHEAVTQRRLAEDALRESEARFRSLTKLSSDWYWEQDAQFRFTVMSGVMLDQVWPHQKLAIGKTRRELHDADPLHQYINLSAADWAAHQAMLEAHRAFRDQVLAHRGPDGQVGFTSISGEPMFDAQGVFKGYRGTGKDITPQKRAEEALRESEARFRSLTELSSDWYWEQDEQLRFVNLSNGFFRVAQLQNEDCLGKTRWEIPGNVPPAAGWAAHREQLARREAYRDLVYSRVLHDGTAAYFSFSGEPMFDSQGAFKGYRGTGKDITPQRRVEQDLLRARERMTFLLASTPAVIFACATEPPYPVSFISDNLRSQFGYEPEEFLSEASAWMSKVHPDDLPRVEAGLLNVIESGQHIHEYRFRQKNGHYTWVQEEARLTRGLDGDNHEIVGYLIDITEKKHFEEQLLHLAHYDSLTELPNRVLFYDRLTQVVAQAERNEWNAGVLFIDLDRFKTVNDTLGHGVGDELLRQVSARLNATVRTGDTVGRLGGDEFAVILGELHQPQDASIVAQKIIRSFDQAFTLNGRDMFVTASIGIAAYPPDGRDPDTLIKNADLAMYRAKQLGRNNMQFYTPEMNNRALERLELEMSLHRALERGEFLLHYQPKVSTRSGKLVGMEALLRWARPGHGLVSPAEFIPILEETGFIVQVGEWVLRAACAQIKASISSGLRPVPIAVNLSARQLQSPGLVDMVRKIFDESGVDPALIELEITESSLMHNTDEAVVLLNALKKTGLRISIDDFGTGYSSLAYLKRFPVDTLKIDRTFVRDIAVDESDAAIARAIITMAHQLSLKVVAEGVETAEQLAFLVKNGCDEAQGFLFSRPVPADSLPSLPKVYLVTA